MFILVRVPAGNRWHFQIRITQGSLIKGLLTRMWPGQHQGCLCPWRGERTEKWWKFLKRIMWRWPPGVEIWPVKSVARPRRNHRAGRINILNTLSLFQVINPIEENKARDPLGQPGGGQPLGGRKQTDEERWSRGQKKAIQNNVIHDSKREPSHMYPLIFQPFKNHCLWNFFQKCFMKELQLLKSSVCVWWAGGVRGILFCLFNSPESILQVFYLTYSMPSGISLDELSKF